MISRRRLDRGVDAVEAVGGLLHGADAALHFLAGAVGDIQQHFGGIGHALNASDHLVDGGRSFADAGSLHLRVLHHVLHVDAHLVHGAGDFIDGGGGLQSDLGRIVGGSATWLEPLATCAGRRARCAPAVQAFGHAGERRCPECRGRSAA